MKKVFSVIIFAAVFTTSIAQDSYYSCDEAGVYLTGGSVTIQLPNKAREKVKQKIMSFIKERKYVFKPFYSTENVISFRDFVKICDKNDCGSNLVAKNIFHLTYDSGAVKIRLENEIYSSFYGAELVINDNDDVASKKNIPFAPYEFQVPEQYADEYPEAIYTFSKKGKVKVKNPEVRKTILDFFNRYITDLKFYLENN